MRTESPTVAHFKNFINQSPLKKRQQLLKLSYANHPTLHMSRKVTTDVQRQNMNIRTELTADIDQYLRSVEDLDGTHTCLDRHESILPHMRARMVDWMVEVLTNFKCDDQTFFIAVSLMDRFFQNTLVRKEVSDLHIIGVTSMFLASKFEDIVPLRMSQVYEKIAHRKLEKA